MMDLVDTVDLMMSEDYKDRFVAEYAQLAIRRERLAAMLHKYDHGTLDFTPTCPIELLREQLDAMEDYMSILEKRAILEGIDLDI